MDHVGPRNSSRPRVGYAANVGSMATFLSLCLDTANPGSDVATFWAAVSGGTAKTPRGGGPADVFGGAEHENLLVCPVPEPKTVKNRMHFDVLGNTSALLTAGARMVRQRDADTEPDGAIEWDVLADPEGNEFCVFSPE
jgi:hypothetical protein